jgi:hypothetical protein
MTKIREIRKRLKVSQRETGDILEAASVTFSSTSAGATEAFLIFRYSLIGLEAERRARTGQGKGWGEGEGSAPFL